ncbi:MAG: MATE family efflux transporter [Chitinophagales bacterium]|nr:MATE family efflux transporter [Chitinophagales bacterium]
MQIENSYKAIWQIAYPIILGSIAHSINQMVDTAFMGRVSTANLGASNLAGLYFFNLTFIATGFTRGCQVIIAKRAGENNLKAIGKTIDHLLIITLLLILSIYILLDISEEWIIPKLVHSTEIVDLSLDYLQIRKFGVPFILMCYGFNAFYSGIAKTKIITYASVIMALVNIGFGYLFIFGNFGFPKLGIKGAAISSIVAEFVMMMIYILYFIYQKYQKQFEAFQFKALETKLFKRITQLSSPIVLQNIIAISSWQVFFLCIEKVGQNELAASSILKSIYIFIGIPVWGFGATASTVVSNLIGQGKSNDILNSIKKVIILSVSLTMVANLMFLIFSNQYLHFFTNDQIVIDLFNQSKYVLSIGVFIFSFTLVLSQGIVGTGATTVTALFEFILSIFYISFCLYFIYYKRSGMLVSWLSEIIYWFGLFILSLWYLRSNHWKKYISYD